jgi:hypothetical protein
MKINPINNHFVADVDGIDIGTLCDEDFEAVYQAWLQFGVLRLHTSPLMRRACNGSAAASVPWKNVPWVGCQRKQERKSKTGM